MILILAVTVLPLFAQQRNDYAKPETWLCRPSSTTDACAIADLTTTVVSAQGKLKTEKWKGNPKAPIDCFYVYPTVSNDTTPNSDMNAGPEEISVILHQFARFGSQCLVFAPLYRQVTLTALRANMAGRPMAADRTLGYNDVLDAWNHYLKNDNKGRGVILIGHSQGALMLSELVKNEIEGKPAQKHMVCLLRNRGQLAWQPDQRECSVDDHPVRGPGRGARCGELHLDDERQPALGRSTTRHP